MMLDQVAHPNFRCQAVTRPLFVIGNPRSGTTFLHRLLALDEERYVSFRTWEIALPSIVQKTAVRSMRSVLDSAVQRGARMLVKATGTRDVLGEWQALHPLAIDEPEEDEFLHFLPFTSPSLSIAFPYMDEVPRLFSRFDDMPCARRQEIMAYYHSCLQRQLHLDGGARTLLSKNPAFVCRIRSLLETYPDARFVYAVRDPRDAIVSMASMMRFLWQQVGIGEQRIELALARVVKDCIEDYHYAIETLALVPTEQWTAVRYSDLVGNPKHTVEHVYAQLGMKPSANYVKRLSAAATIIYESTHEYDAASLGIDIESVVGELGCVYERWGLG